MAEDTTQWLMTLICEDRAELRTIRSNISSYSATFLSLILGVLAASRGGDKAILTSIQSICLSIGLVFVYLTVAIERYLSLRKIRNYLMRRETVFLGTDSKDSAEYSIDRIRILYSNPDDYSISNHLKRQLGDKNYLNFIIGTALIACIIIIVSYFL